jgi:hypothetical protein
MLFTAQKRVAAAESDVTEQQQDDKCTSKYSLE